MQRIALDLPVPSAHPRSVAKGYALDPRGSGLLRCQSGGLVPRVGCVTSALRPEAILDTFAAADP